ncbi:MAG: glycosyl hydrolase [Lachnospiraceae bacterium]
MKITYQSEKFSDTAFHNPGPEYRGAPFWAWNGKLDKDTLIDQMAVFKEMGFGGFHIHARIGLASEYLGKEFMEYVQECHRYAMDNNMIVYLYDEDKWPSGYGAGRVTTKREFRSRYLLFSPEAHEDGHYNRKVSSGCRLNINGDLTCIAYYHVTTKNGRLVEYSVEKEKNETVNWYCYLVVTDENAWFNNSAYVDTLNPSAIERFAKVSYEPYYDVLGSEFSKSIPSIFTDEPQFPKAEFMKSGDDPQEVGLPYTESMETEFIERYGKSFIDHLPEMFWDWEDIKSEAVLKYQYFNLLADRFAKSYAGTLGTWCEEHNIMLTGHLMEEGGLEKQMRSVGDVMRCYFYFQKIGIDILADFHEYSTAKQAQSVARQMSRPGLTSELYGVTNWNYDFGGHKMQGDWQCALGVTTRVPHLAWMYMNGESKRDYPAPIDAHSPWFMKYKIIEDYFARVNLAMTQGKPDVNVCIIHPIESMFMEYGAEDEHKSHKTELDQTFQKIIEGMLFGLIDFDFISEALLTELEQESDTPDFKVGKMSYKTVIVPPLITIRKTTLQKLHAFAKRGGNVIVMGKFPQYVDGAASNQAELQLEKYTHIDVACKRLLEYLNADREIDIIDEEGIRKTDLIYQLRSEGDERWLFVAHGKSIEKSSVSIAPSAKQREKCRVMIKGCYAVTLYDAMHDRIEEADYENTDEHTTIVYADIYDQDSLLLHLKENKNFQKSYNVRKQTTVNEVFGGYLNSETPYVLEEPNVSVLDMGEYRIEDGEWQEREELLKIDNIIRQKFGYPLRTDSFAQPWLTSKKGQDNDACETHKISLRFRIQCTKDIENVELASECMDADEFYLNGERLESPFNGYYVDTAIRKRKIGTLQKGENILLYQFNFTNDTNLEWLYLLGDFSVSISGSRQQLGASPEKIGFGDIATQGFPFYGGNIVYRMEEELPEGELSIKISEYEAPLLEVSIDGKKAKEIFMDPYQVQLGKVSAGRHAIHIRCYGNRINTFGQLHNCNAAEVYFGPKTWRTEGEEWCYEYRLHKNGILKAPTYSIQVN